MFTRIIEEFADILENSAVTSNIDIYNVCRFTNLLGSSRTAVLVPGCEMHFMGVRDMPHFRQITEDAN
jgi:hypothetical protein